MTEYARHPYSVMFNNPAGEEATIQRLMESMGKDGFDKAHPIILVDTPQGKMILDGWHRYLAAKRMGIEPVVLERKFESDGAMVAYVEKENSARKDVGKRRLLAGMMAADAHRPQKDRRSSEDLAAQAGCSLGEVRRMRKLPVLDLRKVAEGEAAAPLIRKTQTKRAVPTGFSLTGKAVEQLESSIQRHGLPHGPQEHVRRALDVYDQLLAEVRLSDMAERKANRRLRQMVRLLVASAPICEGYRKEGA